MKQFTLGDYQRIVERLESKSPDKRADHIEVAYEAYKLAYQRATTRALKKARRANKGGKANELQNSCN